MKKKKLLFTATIILVLLVAIGIFLSLFNEKKKTPKEKNIVVPAEEKKPDKKSMSIVMVGDSLIHGAVYLDAHTGGNNYDFKDMFTLMKDRISGYDLKYYNQETVIGGKNLGVSHYPQFNSPDEIGLDLIDTGFNMVSLATNHTLDKGETGVLYTVDFWKNQDVISSGVYSSFEDRNAIPTYEQNGIKFAFLNYTTSTNGIPVPYGKEYLVNVYSDEKAKSDIESIKDKVDVIIVAMHWGEEYHFEPVDSQKRIAKYLSSLGVNLIIGAHPHVIEPVDYIDNTLVIYSLGNFIHAQHPLGLDKTIGLLVGVNIVVNEDGNVTFENLEKELLYVYCTSSYTNFKVYPFSKLDDSILNNYKNIESEYMNIVNEKVEY